MGKLSKGHSRPGHGPVFGSTPQETAPSREPEGAVIFEPMRALVLRYL